MKAAQLIAYNKKNLNLTLIEVDKPIATMGHVLIKVLAG